jgi:SPP1 gp7 family putative phage head morphogenesis protein
VERKPLKLNVQNVQQQFEFLTSPNKVKAFRKWLQQQVDAKVLKPVDGIKMKPWTATYIESAYKKGILKGYTQVHAETLAGKPNFYEASKTQFLKDTFGQAERLSKVELIYERAYSDLKGITDTMGTKMSRVLANGLANGQAPAKIARDMREEIGSLTRSRALAIARTEIIHAHAEGQLDSFDMLGIEQLGVEVEWSTAGDDDVCEECDGMSKDKNGEPIIYTVDEARGLIPYHPNCRCAWIPYINK